MKLYFVTWTTNYGVGAAVIEASDRDNCIKICDESTQIWDGYDINEIVPSNNNEILFIES